MCHAKPSHMVSYVLFLFDKVRLSSQKWEFVNVRQYYVKSKQKSTTLLFKTSTFLLKSPYFCHRFPHLYLTQGSTWIRTYLQYIYVIHHNDSNCRCALQHFRLVTSNMSISDLQHMNQLLQMLIIYHKTVQCTRSNLKR